MDDRIIKYYVGELSGEEQKALLQEAFSNQELKKQMMEYQHLQSLMQLHPQKRTKFQVKKACGVLCGYANQKRKKIVFQDFTLCSDCNSMYSVHLVDYLFIGGCRTASAGYSGTICSCRPTCTYCIARWK